MNINGGVKTEFLIYFSHKTSPSSDENHHNLILIQTR